MLCLRSKGDRSVSYQKLACIAIELIFFFKGVFSKFYIIVVKYTIHRKIQSVENEYTEMNM